MARNSDPPKNRSGNRSARPDRPKFRPRPDKPQDRHGGAKPRQRDAKAGETAFEGERIAKVMARAGLTSRRDAEDWIAAGRVSVNGKVIDSPALNIGPNDRVIVDGAPLPDRERTRLFLYHKPRGLVTTNLDPEGRPTVFERLPSNLPRLLSVGRLDIGTEGLLLLTNDGGLARVLELPETGWLRRYRVRALGHVTQPDLDTLRDGITIEGIHYGAIEATLDREQGSNVWLTFAIREGKNREVRNVLGHLGLQVNRLIRVSYGPFQINELGEGEVEEVRTRVLREQLGERVAEEANCDFTSPIVQRQDEAPPERPARRDERAREPRRDDRGGRETREAPRGRFDAKGPRRDDRDDRGPRRFDARNADERRPPRRGDDERPPPRDKRPDRAPPPDSRPRRGDAWRADDAPLRRHYRGERKAEQTPEPQTEKRTGLVTDRKGRRVLVERYGAPKPPPEKSFPKGGSRKRFDDRGDKRADGPRGERAFKAREDRPDKARGDRPFKPRGERPDKPHGERPYKSRDERSDRPQGERRFERKDDRGFKPREDRPFKPRGDRPDKPRGERSDKPQGERRFERKDDRGFKPKGDRPFKPRGDRPDKPRGDRPFKPHGERSGKPGRRPSKPDRSSGPRPSRPRET